MNERQKYPEPSLGMLAALFLGMALLLGIFVLIVAGFTDREEQQGTVIIRPADWACVVIYLACAVTALLGWWLRRQGEGEGAAPFILAGSIMGAIINFAAGNNHVLVDNDHFVLQTVPVLGYNCDVAFRDLRRVEVPDNSRNLTFVLNNGEEQSVYLSDLVRAALPDLRQRLRARGIPHWGLG